LSSVRSVDQSAIGRAFGRITGQEGCRVDWVLPVRTSCRPVPLRTVQAVFPAYGSSAPVQSRLSTTGLKIPLDPDRWPPDPG
jgi:hypothetical protein